MIYLSKGVAQKNSTEQLLYIQEWTKFPTYRN